MRYSNSRLWLVRYENRCEEAAVIESDAKKSATTTIQNIPSHKFRMPESRQRKITRTCILQTESVRSMKTTRWRLTPNIAKVKTCLNQIIEVLLALLLANCIIQLVTHLPATIAAFELNILEDEAPSIYAEFRRNDRSYHHSFNENLLYAGIQENDEFEIENSSNQLQRSQNFKISPKPCTFGRIEGTCMFVWECIKSEGQHVGMCVDSFMFGSCCVHNYTDNIILPHAFSYTRPTKPVGIANINHRPRPPHQPHRPIISGMTTIERPHGAGTLVIRPSGPHHQGALHRPMHTKPTTSTPRPFITNSAFITTSLAYVPHSSQNEVLSDSLSSPSSTSNNVWNSSPTQQYLYQQTTSSSTQHQQHQQQQQQQQQHQQHHWHLSTEPNFITKPRPTGWDKPSSLRPKPSKPTKKPTATAATERPLQHQAQQTPLATIVYTSTRKPTSPSTSTSTSSSTSNPTNVQEPLIYYTKPVTATATATTTTETTTIITTHPYTPYPTISSAGDRTTTIGYQQMQPTKYTTQKYKPSTSSPSYLASSSLSSPPSSSSSSSSSASPSPSYSTTTNAQRPQSAALTPTQYANTTVTTSLAANSSLTLPPQSHTTIESNEIVDATNGATIVKTISAARNGECGIPVLARPETRIVGGKSAAFGRWPWQVSVRRTSFFGFSSTHRCGGALINENWIATAGHCVDDLLISQIRIRVGEYDFSHVQEQLPYIERAVAKKVVHPKYNFFTYEYDLALVKLEQPLEFAPHVSPICLPQTDSLLIGMNATVTGWGRLSEGGTLPSVLQEVSVPIVSNDNCKNMFLRAGRQEFIPEIFLCAGYETGGQDSCQGDSGGPLQVKSQDGRFFLAGIISWGIGCAEANLPGVCTRISKFVPWILETVT